MMNNSTIFTLPLAAHETVEEMVVGNRLARGHIDEQSSGLRDHSQLCD